MDRLETDLRKLCWEGEQGAEMCKVVRLLLDGAYFVRDGEKRFCRGSRVI